MRRLNNRGVGLFVCSSLGNNTRHDHEACRPPSARPVGRGRLFSGMAAKPCASSKRWGREEQVRAVNKRGRRLPSDRRLILPSANQNGDVPTDFCLNAPILLPASALANVSLRCVALAKAHAILRVTKPAKCCANLSRDCPSVLRHVLVGPKLRTSSLAGSIFGAAILRYGKQLPVRRR